MEINQPALEISSHGVCTSDEQVQSRGGAARSYECTFCKKGFSNAQALGGHMNIHRKDKAKLKQASKESQSQRITDHHAPVLANSLTSSRTITTNSALPRDQTHAAAELKQLPLFAETASGPDYSNPSIQASRRWQEELLLSNQGSFGAELDLELRLGQSPPESSSVVMDTRKFF